MASMSHVTNMKPISETLRQKIAVLEGVAVPERDACEITDAVMENGREAPICSEKVMCSVMGWDDMALSCFIESLLDVKVHRLSCTMSNDNDDTLLAEIQTTDMKLLSIQLKGVMLLLPSTNAIKSIMKKTLQNVLDTEKKTVSVTVVKTHNSNMFEGYDKHPEYPWVYVVRLGPASVDPWDAVELYFISLQEYISTARSVASSFSAWCWFFSHHNTVTSVAGVPSSVSSNPHITAIWTRLSSIFASPETLPFSQLYGDSVIEDAISMQVANTRSDQQRHEDKMQLTQHRVGQFRSQLDALNKQATSY